MDVSISREYLVTISPGPQLEKVIATAKTRLRTVLGDALVNDPLESRNLCHPLYIALHIATTKELATVLHACERVAQEFKPITYTTTGIASKTNDAMQDRLADVHLAIQPADQRAFRDLHYAIIQRTKDFIDTKKPHRLFRNHTYAAYEQQNLAYCGFPAGRGNFEPTVHIGRVSPDLLTKKRVREVLQSVRAKVTSTTGPELVVWEYKRDDPMFAIHLPKQYKLVG
jgi:hypothetical protein